MANLWALTLTDNHIGDAGFASLASALPRLPRLQFLDILSNQIGGAGARSFAGALTEGAGSSLCQMDIRNNPIDRAAATLLYNVSNEREINLMIDRDS